VATIDEIAMPAKYRLGADQQPHSMQHVPGEPVQQRCQEGAVSRVEPGLRAAQLAFEHRDLMAQGEDLGVFVPVAHRQQSQHGERVRHAQVCES
jgi:hypothetical protein